MPTSHCSILTGIRIYHGNQCCHKVWMGSNENWGRNSTLKFPAAHGPVFNFKMPYFFFNFWQIPPKSNSLYCSMIRVPCIKFVLIG